MKVNLVCYEEINSWILGKITKRLQGELLKQGILCDVSKYPDPTADINHHICYISWNGRRTNNDTLMVTHIDTVTEFERVRSQLQEAEMGICMSRETMRALANRGLDRSKLCFINPAVDGTLPPRRIAIGLASRLYDDGRKREGMLLEITERISPCDFSFWIIGAGWDAIVGEVRSRGFLVQYENAFSHEAYANFMSGIDYYVYFGTDEGSIGFIDALAAGVPTIVTPQGFHLDAADGIAYSFRESRELERILAKLADAKRRRQRAVADWTWERYAQKHTAVWQFVLARNAGMTVPQKLNSTLQTVGLKSPPKLERLLKVSWVLSLMRKFAPKQAQHPLNGLTAARGPKIMPKKTHEFYGIAEDGWMTPDGLIRLSGSEPKTVTLFLEIPGWLPFEFPLKIRAVQKNLEIATLEAVAPGHYRLDVPLTQEGLVVLSADQWFVPKELGISDDPRKLCYRVVSSQTIAEYDVPQRDKMAISSSLLT
jgi:hypothetical protein